jgi:hypothetical protein
VDENTEQFYIMLAEETYYPLMDLIVDKLGRIISKRTKVVYGIHDKDIYQFITNDFSEFLLIVQKEDIEDLLNHDNTINQMGKALAQRMYERLDFSNICPYGLKK